MNIDLKAEKNCFVKRIFKGRMTREETAEVIVPDALPDILRILDTDGYMCLRGKDSADGRVTVSGTAEITVLYVPESGAGVRRVTASIPMELEGEGPDISSDCLITATLALVGADSRTVNPRKLVVRAECFCDVSLYVPESAYLTSAREHEGLYFRTESRSLRLPVSVTEKTFVFTDEAALGEPDAPVGEVLECVTHLKLESAKPVGSRAVVKGSAESTVLYEDREGGLRRKTVSSPFSQIVETDCAEEPAEVDVALMLTGAYFTRSLMDESGGDGLSLEIHAVAQCTAYADQSFDMVADAYSVRNPVELKTSACSVERLAGRDAQTRTLTVSIPTGERVTSVLYPSARVTGVGTRSSDGGRTATVSVCASAIYVDRGGELLSASRKGELELPLEEGEEIRARVAGDVKASVTDNSVDVEIPLELSSTKYENTQLCGVESVELSENESLDKSALPAVTVVRGGPWDLWELSKKHLSTPELILEASGLEAGSTPEDNCVLLVPRM